MPDGKLVRDRIPEIIRAAGHSPDVRVLGGDELLDALFDKLDEEAAELRAVGDTARIEELADVLEVVRALADRFGIDMPTLVQLTNAKRDERGGFAAGLWLRTPSAR